MIFLIRRKHELGCLSQISVHWSGALRHLLHYFRTTAGGRNASSARRTDTRGAGAARAPVERRHQRSPPPSRQPPSPARPSGTQSRARTREGGSGPLCGELPGLQADPVAPHGRCCRCCCCRCRCCCCCWRWRRRRRRPRRSLRLQSPRKGCP